MASANAASLRRWNGVGHTCPAVHQLRMSTSAPGSRRLPPASLTCPKSPMTRMTRVSSASPRCGTISCDPARPSLQDRGGARQSSERPRAPLRPAPSAAPVGDVAADESGRAEDGHREAADGGAAAGARARHGAAAELRDAVLDAVAERARAGVCERRGGRRRLGPGGPPCHAGQRRRSLYLEHGCRCRAGGGQGPSGARARSPCCERAPRGPRGRRRRRRRGEARRAGARCCAHARSCAH